MLTQYENIQVSVDGSKESDLAFSKAAAIAKRNHAQLHILHVSIFDSAMVEQVSTDAKKRMEEYTARAKKAGITNVEYSIEFGSPKTIIAHDFPKKHNIDLIVVGATGLNAVERLLIGSVTEYVTRTANCDILVCRAKEINDALMDE